MKPASLKPNRLDRVDRLEQIMADQEALGMNREERPLPDVQRRSPRGERTAALPAVTRESRTPQKRD